MAAAGESSTSEPAAKEKPIIFRVKRKPSQARPDAFWLEINERPVKKAMLDLSSLSISEPSSPSSSAKASEEPRVNKVLVQHIETVHSEAVDDVLHSLLLAGSNIKERKSKTKEWNDRIKKEKCLVRPEFPLSEGSGRIPRLKRELIEKYTFLHFATPYRYHQHTTYVRLYGTYDTGTQDNFKAFMKNNTVHELIETSRKIEECLDEIIDLISEIDAVAGSGAFFVPLELVQWFGDIFHPEHKVDSMMLSHLAEPSYYHDEEYDQLPDATIEDKYIYGRLAYFLNRIQYFSACNNEEKIKEYQEKLACAYDRLSSQGIETMPIPLRDEVDRVYSVQGRERILAVLQAHDKRLNVLRVEMEKLEKSSNELRQQLKQLDEDHMRQKEEDKKNSNEQRQQLDEDHMQQKEEDKEKGVHKVVSDESDEGLKECKDKIKSPDEEIKVAREEEEKNLKGQRQVHKVELEQVGQKRQRDVQLTKLEEKRLKKRKVDGEKRTKVDDTRSEDTDGDEDSEADVDK